MKLWYNVEPHHSHKGTKNGFSIYLGFRDMRRERLPTMPRTQRHLWRVSASSSAIRNNIAQKVVKYAGRVSKNSAYGMKMSQGISSVWFSAPSDYFGPMASQKVENWSKWKILNSFARSNVFWKLHFLWAHRNQHRKIRQMSYTPLLSDVKNRKPDQANEHDPIFF